MTDKLIPLNALNSYFDCMLAYENKLLSDPNTSDRTKDMAFGSKTVLELAKKAVAEIAEVSRWETEDNTAHWIKHVTNSEKSYADKGENL